MGAGTAPEDVGVFLVNHKGMVLDPGNATPGSRVAIEEKKETEYESQLWKLREDGMVEHISTGLVLTIPGGNTSAVGTKLTLNHPDASANSQIWRFDEEIGALLCEGRREIALDVEGVGIKGALAIIWYRQQAANAISQRWSFRSPNAATASGSPPPPFPFVPGRALSPEPDVQALAPSSVTPSSPSSPPAMPYDHSSLPPPPPPIPHSDSLLPPSSCIHPASISPSDPFKPLPPPLSSGATLPTPDVPTPGENTSLPLPPPSCPPSSPPTNEVVVLEKKMQSLVVSPHPPASEDSKRNSNTELPNLPLPTAPLASPPQPNPSVLQSPHPPPSPYPYSTYPPGYNPPQYPSPALTTSQYQPPMMTSSYYPPYPPGYSGYSSLYPVYPPSSYPYPTYPNVNYTTVHASVPPTYQPPSVYSISSSTITSTSSYSPTLSSSTVGSTGYYPPMSSSAQGVFSPALPSFQTSSEMDWQPASQSQLQTPQPPSAAATTPPSGLFLIGSSLNDKVLDVDRATSYVITWPRKQAHFTNQLWRMDAEGFIQSVETGMVLEVEGDKGARAGCRVRVGYKKPMDHETVANQRWRYDAQSMGFMNFTGLCLDVDYTCALAATPVLAWTPLPAATRANQRFYFIPFTK